MMTRKDYIATAEILSTYAPIMPEAQFKNLVFDIGAMFIADNPRFDSSKFVNAVYSVKKS